MKQRGERDGSIGSGRQVRIAVCGRLSERLAAAFEGMALLYHGGCTELRGEVADQAQLHGVLTRIRDLGLDLEHVSLVEQTAGQPGPDDEETRGD